MDADAPLSTPFVSVIVPIYNVEKYVKKCLDSLREQTLKQIEVICIDDGSTDRSGEIADGYESSEYPVFRIIHTENRGLSAARNRGIEESRSQWLMFVDSDDWVESGFCEIPWKMSQKYDADMVIFQNYNATEKGRVKKQQEEVKETGIIDHESAIDIGGTAVWRRLCKKELFDNLHYPEGRVFEDSAITHRLVYRSSRILNLKEYLYNYRYRRGSICHSLSSEKDRLEMSTLRYQQLVEFGYPEEKAKAQLVAAALRCCGRMKKDSEVYCDAIEIIKSVTGMGISRYLSIKEKYMLKIWNTNESLYQMMYMTALRSRI